MRIIAIRGKNLASLEGNFEINFDNEPLRSAGIFAITGCTGAGKSTLLDAMCIALFCNSPRINNVSDNVYIDDVKEEKIKERDPRNILRKGCSDCFAQVDFAALDGMVYRATWSTRRARDSKSGRLQDWEYSLFNISESKEIQGRKTELLARVQELLGLTYVQFTRAVLLAQGEFATFLKATSKEKAEILEKLTGTEIYSKISKRIFEHCKEATTELQVIEEKIREIAILSAEERADLDERRNSLNVEVGKCDTKIKHSTERLQWLLQESRLTAELESAQKEFVRTKEALEGLSATEKLLQQIDSIFEIRDDYSQILTCKNECKSNEQLLSDYTQLQITENEHLKKYDDEVVQAIESQQKANGIFQKNQPELSEGQRLEAAIDEKNRSLRECSTALAALQLQYKQEKSQSDILAAEILQEQKAIQIIEEWFIKNKNYEQLVPRSEIIVNNITEIVNSQKQLKVKNELLANAEKEVARNSALLNEERKNLEHIKSTLSTEIVTLRKRLVEGEPCPVCGSRHHEIASTVGETLSEKELEKATRTTEEQIEHIAKIIDNYRIEVAQLKTSIENYNNIYTERLKVTKEILQSLPDVDEKVNSLEFATMLNELSQEWDNKRERLAATREKLSQSQSSYSFKIALCNELQIRISEKEKEQQSIKKSIESDTQLLKKILGTFGSIAEKNRSMHDAIDRANKTFIQATERRNKQLGRCKEIEGAITGCKERKKSLDTRFENLKEKIQDFLSNRKDNMTIEELHKLATIPIETIQNNRLAIETARTNATKALATTEERKRTLEEHYQSPNRPYEGETAESIERLIVSLKEENRMRNEQITQITVQLKRDEENILLYKKYEREYAERLEKKENWQKLQELFGSADGAKFKVMAQGYTLDILLMYANRHLKDISERYELVRISSSSLSIKVIDKDMLSESRSVHSLSGGESFIVSLALALALSSLSSNRMNIESLFIDEGFGSLDSETLRVAMEALEKLQGEGRKIGVISHLTDMIERIPVQINIIKCASGKSKVAIKG